jgi:hypothetical protein
MKRQRKKKQISRNNKKRKLDNTITNEQCYKQIEQHHKQHLLPINPYFKNEINQHTNNDNISSKQAKKQASFIYPGIEFSRTCRPMRIVKPLSINELKLIVALKCNIELRSEQVAQAYKESDKNLKPIQSELDKYYGKTIIRLKNNYPYNLKPQLEHWIAWSKGYTWKDLEQQYYDKRLPFTDTAVFHWINDSRFRSIQSIPHYHIIYERNKRTKTSKMDTDDYTWN